MDDHLRELVEAIVAGDCSQVSRLLAQSPGLARLSFEVGGTRKTEKPYYLAELGKFAAAAFPADPLSASILWFQSRLHGPD